VQFLGACAAWIAWRSLTPSGRQSAARWGGGERREAGLGLGL